MSSAGMVWARQQTVGASTGKSILLLLGELADDTGRVYRGQQYIADTLEVSRETVSRNYNRLEAMGFIAREARWGSTQNQRMTDILRLQMEKPYVTQDHIENVTENHIPNVTQDHIPYVTESHIENVTQSHNKDKPLLKPKEITKNTEALPGLDLPASPEVPKTDESFVEFWAQYPKKVAKKDAEKAFSKAVKRAGLETIMVGLRRFVNMHNADPRRADNIKYLPNAATWLNGDRWEDTMPTARPAATVSRSGTVDPQKFVVVGAVAPRKVHPATLLTEEERERALAAKPNRWGEVLWADAEEILAARGVRV